MIIQLCFLFEQQGTDSLNLNILLSLIMVGSLSIRQEEIVTKYPSLVSILAIITCVSIKTSVCWRACIS